jgi:Flp pilus assembly protein TadG
MLPADGASRRSRLVEAAGRRVREERGVVLVIVAIMMTVFLGMAALAIDIGYFDQQQRQAQSAADAAALAAAPGLPTTWLGNTCPSTAQTAVNTYVAANMSGATNVISCPAVGQITVRVTQTVASIFGRFLGSNSATVGASATAQATGGTATSASCSSPGNTCYAIFAKDTSCSGAGVSFGGGTHIAGGVASSGALSVGGGGSSYGPTYYGSGCTVSPSGYLGQNNTFGNAGGAPQSPPPTTSWPIDYSVDFPPCAGAACTGPGGTPSFCTQASASTSWTLVSYFPGTLTSGNIYCGVGTGIASTPSTWNGAISASQTGSGAIESSYVAGSVTIGGGSSLKACGYVTAGYKASDCSAAVPTPITTNYPLAYVLGTGTAFNDPGGGGDFTGDVFAPNGAITFGGGGNVVLFLEAQDVTFAGGGDKGPVKGDGSSITGGTSSSSGSVSLVQ